MPVLHATYAETLCRARVGMGGLPVNPNALIWNLMLKVKTLELELIEQLDITQKIWYVRRSQVFYLMHL